jgi:DNA-binding protein YbaB
VVERPDWAALYSKFDDLRKAMDGVGETQRKLFKVTGVAWSDDRTIKAVVGPRGQLIELEIDPRIYRKPNSKALAATILATVREAVADATRKTVEIVDEGMPSDMRGERFGSLDLRRLMQSHDGDLPRADGGDDEHVP